MRTLTCLPLALALIGATAHAAPQTGQSESTLGEIQVRATVPTYKPTPAQIEELKGVYVMDDGTALKITQERRRLFAQLGRLGVTELVAIGDNRYSSPDQRMIVEYLPEAFGDQILLTHPAHIDLASSDMVTVRLSAR